MAHVEDRWTVPNPDGGRRIRSQRYGKGSRWLAVWNESDGTRRKRAFSTKDSAQAHLERVGHEQRSGTYVSPVLARETVRETSQRWLEAGLHRRKSTVAAIRSSLDVHVLPAIGDLTWGEVNTRTLQAAVATWVQAGLATSTVHRHWRTVVGLCGYAVQEKRLLAIPTGVRLPMIGRELVRPLTVDQVRALAAAAPPYIRRMVVLGAATGMRLSEMTGLTWDRVIPTEGGGVIRVDRQLLHDCRATRPEWGPPKTPSSVRDIAVGPKTIAALGARGEGLVVRNSRGNLIDSRIASYWWRAMCEKASVEAPGWHALRHHHASLLIAAGMSPVAVSHRLGHKDVTLTLSTYAHLWPTDEARMVEATDGLAI